MKIITRFPPSPTGNLHIGGARTALFNYLFAKQKVGKIYLRLENTDEERSKPEYEKNILESLNWLGITFDTIEGKPFWRQSECTEIYRSYLKKLVDGGQAYISKESVSDSPFSKGSTREGEGFKSSGLVRTNFASQNLRGRADSATSFKKGGTKRVEVIRFRNPNKKIAFADLIRGTIEFDTTELGDMVIAKSLEEPLYHLAVVVDDYEMGITHVIRGEDHISNTPRQILLQEALGFNRPEYAHIPLILAPDRSKLSKRHGAVSVTEYRDKGYLPEALVNYLALLGWNPGTEQEIFSLDELVKTFDLSKVQKGGAIFSQEKLRWFNKEYLKKAGGADAILPHIPKDLTDGKSPVQVKALAEMLFERISVFGDIRKEFEAGEYEYILKKPVYSPELLFWPQEARSGLETRLIQVKIRQNLDEAIQRLNQIDDRSFDKVNVGNTLFKLAKERTDQRGGKGNVLWPVRVALSGREKSPDPFTLAAILGKDEALRRLQKALHLL